MVQIKAIKKKNRSGNLFFNSSIWYYYDFCFLSKDCVYSKCTTWWFKSNPFCAMSFLCTSMTFFPFPLFLNLVCSIGWTVRESLVFSLALSFHSYLVDFLTRWWDTWGQDLYCTMFVLFVLNCFSLCRWLPAHMPAFSPLYSLPQILA